MLLPSSPTEASMLCVLGRLRSVRGASTLDEMALRSLRHQFARHLGIALSPQPLPKPDAGYEQFLRQTAASIMFDLQVDEETREDFLKARVEIAAQLDTTWELLAENQA